MKAQPVCPLAYVVIAIACMTLAGMVSLRGQAMRYERDLQLFAEVRKDVKNASDAVQVNQRLMLKLLAEADTRRSGMIRELARLDRQHDAILRRLARP
ncbi:MAG: hypothetical protein IT514_16530 [Burkholderiales bacterium]|nr:hypothetical protein [Burkholderiales bacterium]